MGTLVGKYEITSKIAEGGMGAVFKAKHPTLNRDVILKKLTLKRSSSITERFKREARLMIDFSNDNIVQVYDHFKEGSSYYIVMEYVDGIDLGDLIKKKRYLSNEMAMLIFNEICKALKYAHDKNVIHRDIKPDNILISKEGEVKLTDFGIATSKDEDEKELTTAGMTLGTPAYMSPEQISDTKNVDKRADIYSMGVLLYEMIVGKCPFPRSFTPESISLIEKGDYTSAKKINPKVAPIIQKIIKKAMHHKIKKRYKDLGYVIALLCRNLKKYPDQNLINNAIKHYVYDTQPTDAELKKIEKCSDTKSYDGFFFRLSTNLGKLIIAIILFLGLIACSVYYLYLNGYHYEYLDSKEYGALQIVIKLNKKYKNPEDLYINTHLYIKGKKRYTIVKDINMQFEEDKERTGRKYYYFKSNKIYLKAANYRGNVNFEDHVYQEDFFLNSRFIQKKGKETLEAKIIQFDHKPVSRLPLKVNYSVINNVNRMDITNKTDLYIKVRNRWKKWGDFKELKNYKDILMTSKTYRFKLVKEDFYSEYIRVYVKPYQTVLNFKANLVPIPGNLYIKSNYEGLDILLNNSQYYSSGGRRCTYKEISPSTLKYQRLLLPPGDYFLSIKKSNSISKTERIYIKPDESTKVIVKYDKKKERINLKIL
ncbi:MAG: serine/threonine-protein kinase [Spirochaetota bacterium]|nr:serine/threonine-protein kinase [Spirochaetota bacterium]